MKKIIAALIFISIMFAGCDSSLEESTESSENSNETSTEEISNETSTEEDDNSDLNHNFDYNEWKDIVFNDKNPEDDTVYNYDFIPRMSGYELLMTDDKYFIKASSSEQAEADVYASVKSNINVYCLRIKDGEALPDPKPEKDETIPYSQKGFVYIESFGKNHCILIPGWFYEPKVSVIDIDGDGSDEIVLSIAVGMQEVLRGIILKHNDAKNEWTVVYDSYSKETWITPKNNYGTGLFFETLDNYTLKISNAYTDYEILSDYTDNPNRSYYYEPWESGMILSGLLHEFAAIDVNGDGSYCIKISLSVEGMWNYYDYFGTAKCYLKFSPDGSYEIVNSDFTQTLYDYD